jgi:hypothetical protein
MVKTPAGPGLLEVVSTHALHLVFPGEADLDHHDHHLDAEVRVGAGELHGVARWDGCIRPVVERTGTVAVVKPAAAALDQERRAPVDELDHTAAFFACSALV